MAALPLWMTTFLRKGLRTARLARNRGAMALRGMSAVNKAKPRVIVLSLDRLGASREVARQAYLRGYNVHVFAPSFPVLDATYAHGWTRLDPRTDFDRAVAVARMLDPVAILFESKNLLLPMQNHLATALGLRASGDKAVTTSNSKIALRRELDNAGIANVPWIAIENYSEGNFTFPCVIKPDLGTASKGVRIVQDHQDLTDGGDIRKMVVNDPSVGDRMLLEGFVKGRQFDLEGVAIDGKYYLICLVEECYESAPPYFPPSWFYFNPPISDTVHAKLWETTQAALRAMGVRNGGWHMEQRLNAKGEVIVLDYANRMGYNLLISAAAGTSFAGKYVDLMTGHDVAAPVLAPRTQLQIFAFEEDTLARMSRLIRDRPANVQSKSMFSYEFSFHLYLGYVVVQFADHAELMRVLGEYDLVPELFASYYSDPAQLPERAS